MTIAQQLNSYIVIECDFETTGGQINIIFAIFLSIGGHFKD